MAYAWIQQPSFAINTVKYGCYMTAGEVCGSETQMLHSVFAQSITTGKTFPSKRFLNLREGKYCRRVVVCRPDGLLCLYTTKKG